ncbi:MAG TPA: hypothetical protein PLC80_16965 [Draconibacterium sp.]|nr:hypothetical protein [Draconibacterium sp.]
MLNNIKTGLLIAFGSIAVIANAQRDTTLNREVEVVKSFKPTIQDAHKINDMPKIEETEHQKPTFDYNIKSEPIVNAFAVNPLKAASIASAPKEETGYGLIRAGAGNYNRPYAELFFNHLPSKKSIFGIHAKHLSSNGTLKLEGGDRVDAPFSNNEAEVYFNQFLKESVLSFNVDYDRDAFNYYGYPLNPVPDQLTAPNQTINYFGTKQVFSKGGISVKLDNPTLEMKDPYFGFDFDYHYFSTKTGQNENYGKFVAHVQKPFNFGTGLLDAGVFYTQANNIENRNDNNIDNRQQSWLYLNPAVFLGKKIFNAKLGIKTWYISDKYINAQARVTPDILLNFIPAENIIKLYAGISGNYDNNFYSKIAYENPFVDPEHDAYNSFEKIRFFGGFDGKFAAKTNFKIGFDYSMIDNQPFYYLQEYTLFQSSSSSTKVVDNDFSILYDDINLFKINLEIIHRSSDKLDLLLSGNYFVYKMDEQKEAWNMPAWDATLSLGYKITEQLSMSADFFLIGERKALIRESLFKSLPPSSSVANPMTYKSFNLDTAFDMNVRGNYKITEKFSVFAQLNNFGFQQYQRWFGYPVQSLNFLAGVSYAF